MASHRITLDTDTISMTAAAADSLISRGQGDPALLYLYLLRHQGYLDPDQSAKELGWSRLQLDSALTHLRELGLAGGVPQPQFNEAVPKREQAPAYSADDLNQELKDQTSAFPDLLSEVEVAMGKRLSPSDTKILLELYDHLALPPEVIYQLVIWQIQEHQDKYGQGRKPRMSVIRTAAYRWKESGVDTLEAAEAYLKKLEYYRSQEGALLAAVGITGRKAAPGERKYLTAWAEMGFPAEMVAMAYDRTVTNTGTMKWAYCNAILKRWHSEGRHTPEDVTAGERHPHRNIPQKVSKAPAPAPVQTAAAQEDKERQILENERWMKAFLTNQEKNS